LSLTQLTIIIEKKTKTIMFNNFLTINRLDLGGFSFKTKRFYEIYNW